MKPPRQVERKTPEMHVYQKAAKRVLRREMKEASLSYETVAIVMQNMGLSITARGVENKVARGTFSAEFFFFVIDMCGSEVETRLYNYQGDHEKE